MIDIYSKTRPYLRDLYLRLFGFYKKPAVGIHILNGHYITPFIHDTERDRKIFENFVQFIAESNTLIKIEDAVKMIQEGKIPNDRSYVAFTFDDGFEECATVIAPTLEKYGCNAAFFINANYIESKISYQKEYNERTKTYVKHPLNWEQVRVMHEKGHIIGCHTLDHVRATDCTLENFENQILRNKQILEKRLNYCCDFFAWTYGRLTDCPLPYIHILDKYYKVLFSADNNKHYTSYGQMNVLNRRHVESFWPKSHIKYFLSQKIENQ